MRIEERTKRMAVSSVKLKEYLSQPKSGCLITGGNRVCACAGLQRTIVIVPKRKSLIHSFITNIRDGTKRCLHCASIHPFYMKSTFRAHNIMFNHFINTSHDDHFFASLWVFRTPCKLMLIKHLWASESG